VFVFFVEVDIFSLVFDMAERLGGVVLPVVGGYFFDAEGLVCVSEFA
jgi:hypothetical protein